MDGNKRLAFLSTHTFFEINGYELDISLDEGYELVLEIAGGDVDLEEIASRLRTKKIN